MSPLNCDNGSTDFDENLGNCSVSPREGLYDSPHPLQQRDLLVKPYFSMLVIFHTRNVFYVCVFICTCLYVCV